MSAMSMNKFLVDRLNLPKCRHTKMEGIFKVSLKSYLTLSCLLPTTIEVTNDVACRNHKRQCYFVAEHV